MVGSEAWAQGQGAHWKGQPYSERAGGDEGADLEAQRRLTPNSCGGVSVQGMILEGVILARIEPLSASAAAPEAPSSGADVAGGEFRGGVRMM